MRYVGKAQILLTRLAFGLNTPARYLTFAALVLLASCAGVQPIPKTLTITKTVYVPWVWPGALQACAPDPGMIAIPHIVATDPHAGSQVAAYIARLRLHDARALYAADDCRDTLNAAVAANKGAQ